MSLRSPRRVLARLSIATAAGALLASVVATPALADNDWGDGNGNGNSTQSSGRPDNGGGTQNTGRPNSGGGEQSTGRPNGNGNGSTQSTGRPNGSGNGNTQSTGRPNGNDSGSTQSTGRPNSSSSSSQQGSWEQHGDHDNQRLYRGVVTASELFLRSAPNRGGQIIRVAHRGEHVSIFCKTAGQNIDGNNLWYLLTDGTWAWGAARYIDNIGPAPRWC